MTSKDAKKNIRIDHASYLSRFVAFKIDGLVSVLFLIPFLIFMILYLPRFVSPDESCFLYFAVLIGGLTLYELVYFTVMETFYNTLGKGIRGIKVVNRYGKPITFKQGLIRNFERVIWMIPLFGWIYMYMSVSEIKDANQRFGDGWADTYVVKLNRKPGFGEYDNTFDRDTSLHRGF